MKKFDAKKHTLEYFEKEWEITESTLLYKRIVEIGLSNEDLCHVLWAMVETCPYCNDSDRGCQCWNDE